MTGNTAVYHFKTYQLAYRTLRFLFLQHRTISEILAFYKLGNPSQSGFDRRRGIVQIISIQAEAHFKTKRIAGTESDRLDTEFRACLEHGIPYLHRRFRIEVEFKTTCTGIAGIGNNDIRFACKLTVRKGIIREFGKVDGSQFLQCLDSLRTLYGKLCHAVGSILQFGALRIMRHTPVPVLLYIGSIDNQQILLRLILIDEQVVHNTAILIGKASVLHFTGSKGCHIIRSNFLQKVQSVRTLHPKFSHMGDIEHAYTLANGEMLIDDTGIFDRHIVSRKFVHLSTQRDVCFCKRSGFHGRIYDL